MADKKSKKYDLEGARKSEIPDEESLTYLSGVYKYDLEAARKAGIPDEESLTYLANMEPPKAEVYEKESPEFFGGLTGAAGAIGATGDILFSKGRPLFRAGEKLFGVEDPNVKVKPRQFSSPAEVAERAIGLRSPQTGAAAPGAVENYGRSQFVSPEGKGLYYGAGDTGDYAGARKAAERAIQTEQMFPEMKVLQGKTPLAVPQNVASQVEAQRAEEARLRDIENQREVNRMAQMRAERLNERTRLKNLANRGQMVRGSQTVATKAGAPIVGGYELGAQGAQAYNRLTREDLQPSDVAAGVTNIAGAGLGGAAMLPGGKYRLPKALGSVGLNYLSDVFDVRNPRKSVLEEAPPPEMAAGGLAGYAKGKIVKATRDLILPPAENAARTQIIGTLPTYSKAAEILRQQGATGRGIDVGAGLGEGSKILGKNFDTMEPYAKGWNPTYTSASQMPSDAYGQLTNLNVLNVMPRQMRDELVENMGRTMERGGTGIITTRGADVMKAQGRPGPEEMSMITSRDTYQKGFTKQELEDYLRYMLGEKFDVNKLNLGPAGATIKKKAEGGRAVNLQEKKEKSPFSFSMNELKPMPGSETPGMQLPPGVVARLQLEKELEKAKLRAGMSGLAMAVPGKQGVQTIPGAYDVGVNMPVGKGNLDVGAFRSMQPIPDKGYAQGVNVKYTMPFAEGGSTTPAWQRAEGKSPSGGLNALGRASYKRETGGELKPPQPEGGSRKKSFCARMGGMKKKLTSSKTANDPDSRINKALRKWKC